MKKKLSKRKIDPAVLVKIKEAAKLKARQKLAVVAQTRLQEIKIEEATLVQRWKTNRDKAEILKNIMLKWASLYDAAAEANNSLQKSGFDGLEIDLNEVERIVTKAAKIDVIKALLEGTGISPEQIEAEHDKAKKVKIAQTNQTSNANYNQTTDSKHREKREALKETARSIFSRGFSPARP